MSWLVRDKPAVARPRKRLAIVQSCYIPWKGYFDLINSVDEFVLYDDRQFTRRDWRNRNRVKTPQGTIWLTIPVAVKGRYYQRVDETVVSDRSWADRHWQTLLQTYGRALHFDAYATRLAEAYERAGAEERLSAVNRLFLEEVCALLGITTALRWSTDYDAIGQRTERLVSICRAAAATDYLSGPSARAYMDEAVFADAGIWLEYFDYAGYPEYPQLHGPFTHEVTILDLLFNVGGDAPRYMKSFTSDGSRANSPAG
jgi:WbqC-like protein family